MKKKKLLQEWEVTKSWCRKAVWTGWAAACTATWWWRRRCNRCSRCSRSPTIRQVAVTRRRRRPATTVPTPITPTTNWSTTPTCRRLRAPRRRRRRRRRPVERRLRERAAQVSESIPCTARSKSFRLIKRRCTAPPLRSYDAHLHVHLHVICMFVCVVSLALIGAASSLCFHHFCTFFYLDLIRYCFIELDFFTLHFI